MAATACGCDRPAHSSDVRIVPPADVRFDGVAFSPRRQLRLLQLLPDERAGGFASLFKVPVLGGSRRASSRTSTAPSRSRPTASRWPSSAAIDAARGERPDDRDRSTAATRTRLARRKRPTAPAGRRRRGPPTARRSWRRRSRRVPSPARLCRRRRDGRLRTQVGEPWAFAARRAVAAGRAVVPRDRCRLQRHGDSRRLWQVSYPSGDAHARHQRSEYLYRRRASRPTAGPRRRSRPRPSRRSTWCRAAAKNRVVSPPGRIVPTARRGSRGCPTAGSSTPRRSRGCRSCGS